MSGPNLVDTSAAVPLLVASHDHHDEVSTRLGSRRVQIVGHAAFETFSVLTRLPGDARLTADDAHVLIRDNFGDPLHPVRDTATMLSDLVRAGVTGGAVYDGLVALSASDHVGATLYSRDLRAAATYARIGVRFELLD